MVASGLKTALTTYTEREECEVMREIQRYIITTSPGGLCMAEPSDAGSWCSYSHVEFYKRQYWMAVFINIVVVLACAVLAALLVHEKASHGPVAVPMGAGEKASLLMGMQDMQADKERAEKQRDDLIKLTSNYKAQIKALNAKEDGHVAQLAALQARGQEMDRLNKEQAQRMSTRQGFVLEAKRVLGVEHVQIVDR